MPAKLSDTQRTVRMFIRVPEAIRNRFRAECEKDNRQMSDVARMLFSGYRASDVGPWTVEGIREALNGDVQ